MTDDPKPPKGDPLYSDKMGHRHYTLAALREKVEDQFHAETNGRADILADLDTREKRSEAIAEVLQYVLAAEYVVLPRSEQQHILEEALANIFYFGPLDAHLRDPQITEITMESFYHVTLRRGFGPPQTIDSPFENLIDLERTLGTLLAPAGAVISEDTPFIEVGLTLHQRPVRASIIAPPINPMYSVQLRLHPPQPRTLDDLAPDLLPTQAADLLLAGLAEGQGLIITGEVGMGKTSLLAALLRQAAPADCTVVERAAEMSLPPGLTHLTAAAPRPLGSDEAPPPDFEAQIEAAIAEHQPRCLALDEIRGDESLPLWRALTAEAIQQVLIVFRGTGHAQRLHSALSMALRKRQYSLEQSAIDAALQAKLGRVAVLGRPSKGANPTLLMIGAWQAEGDGLTLTPLYRQAGVRGK